MEMKFIVVGLIDFSLHLCCKVFDRALPPCIAYYKNKRPPPIA